MKFLVNTDCWRLILELLNFEDHISLANSSLNFQKIIGEFYATKKKWTLNISKYFYTTKRLNNFLMAINDSLELLELKNFSPNYMISLRNFRPPMLKSISIELHGPLGLRNNNGLHCFSLFMENVSESLEELLLTECTSQDLKLLWDLSFPKITKLILKCVKGCDPSEQLLETFVAIKCPRLKSFALTPVPTTGRSIHKFAQLDELELAVDKRSSAKCFREIFLKLRLRKLKIQRSSRDNCDRHFDVLKSIYLCQTLEELHIDNHCISGKMIEKVKNLKQLKKLVFNFNESACFKCDFDYFLMRVVNKFQGNVETLILHEVQTLTYEEVSKRHLRKMRNLQRLIFFNTESTYEPLAELTRAGRKSLREFRFVKEDIYCIEEDLLDLMRQCKNLEIFDVSKTDCGIDFLLQAIEILCVSSEERPSKFLFRCFETNIKPYHLEKITLPDFMEISMEEELFELPANECISIEFNITE